MRFKRAHISKQVRSEQDGANKIGNFTFLFGCDPQNGVIADTQFIKEFT
jgi:hypothetical protein